MVGYRWCAWTQRSAGRPPLICVLVDGVWLTLSVQRESDAPDAGSVGQAAAFVHDGSRWRDVPGAPFVLHRRWPAADSMPWTRELLRIAGALAPLPVATLLDDPAVATRIVREAAAATIEGAAAS